MRTTAIDTNVSPARITTIQSETVLTPSTVVDEVLADPFNVLVIIVSAVVLICTLAYSFVYFKYCNTKTIDKH